MGSRLRLAIVLAAASCGPGAAGDRPAGPAVPASLPIDEEIALPEQAIEGVVLTPQALGLPEVPEVARGESTVATARGALGRGARAADAQLFATLAWEEADAIEEARGAEAIDLRTEARDALRRVRDAAGTRVDEATLQMLPVAELRLGDLAAAAAAFRDLGARFPTHASARTFQIWLAALELRLGHLDEAARLIARWDLVTASDFQAYVMAWIAFARGDDAAARAAIAAACAAWHDGSRRPAVERELLQIFARGEAEVAEAVKVIAAMPREEDDHRYLLLFNLSEAYQRAGRYDRAADALDAIVAQRPPGEVPPEDLVAIRFRQADDAFRLDRPAVAARRALEAQRGLAACGAACAGETAEAVVARIARLAQFSHAVFTSAQDPAHLDAALELYRAYLALPGRPDREEVRGYLTALEAARASAPPGGRHGEKLIEDLVRVRGEALAACYEGVLVGQPALQGAIELRFEVAADGRVTRAATVPGPGPSGLPAVARCLERRVKAWSFPRRRTAGVTRVRLPLGFRPAAVAR